MLLYPSYVVLAQHVTYNAGTIPAPGPLCAYSEITRQVHIACYETQARFQPSDPLCAHSCSAGFIHPTSQQTGA